jgi:hypothetical protein
MATDRVDDRLVMAGASRSLPALHRHGRYFADLAIGAYRAASVPAGKFGTSGHGRDWVTAFIKSIHRGA